MYDYDELAIRQEYISMSAEQLMDILVEREKQLVEYKNEVIRLKPFEEKTNKLGRKLDLLRQERNRKNTQGIDNKTHYMIEKNIIYDYMYDKTVTEISKEFKITRTTIYKILERNGIELRKR